jgi:hypothetical protein
MRSERRGEAVQTAGFRGGRLARALLAAVTSALWAATPAVAQQPITCGELVSASIGVAGEQDTYTFDGSAGEAVVISAMGTWGGLTALAELHAPGGGLIGSNGFGNGRSASLVLTSSGTHTIIVRGSSGTQTGNYNLSLRFTTGRCATAIACAEMKSGTLAAGEMQSYSFSASAGEAVRVSAVNTSADLSAVVALYGPNGALVGENTFGDGRTGVLSLSTTGTYTVLVYDYSTPSEYGSYNLSIGFTTGRCGTSIACGETADAYLAVGEIHTYSFEGAAGTSTTFASTRVSGSVSAVIELYDPSGPCWVTTNSAMPPRGRSSSQPTGPTRYLSSTGAHRARQASTSSAVGVPDLLPPSTPSCLAGSPTPGCRPRGTRCRPMRTAPSVSWGRVTSRRARWPSRST